MNQVFSYFDNEALYPALDVDLPLWPMGSLN